jgi:hypothetical protein
MYFTFSKGRILYRLRIDSKNRQDKRNDRSEKANEATDDYAFEANDEDFVNDKHRVSWILDNGYSSHMIKEKFVFNQISGDVFLAGKGSVTKSEGIGSINLRLIIITLLMYILKILCSYLN